MEEVFDNTLFIREERANDNQNGGDGQETQRRS